MKPLTQKQATLLDAIIAGLVRDQVVPTTRQLCVEMGLRSTNGVHEHLRAIVRKGYVEKAGRHLRILRWPDGAAFSLVAKRGAVAA